MQPKVLMRLWYVFYFALGVTSMLMIVAGFYAGQNVKFSQQWPLYEALRNTAAIIFAVVGAWLAIIYPDKLKSSFAARETKTESTSSGLGMGLLLTPAVHSTILLALLLLIGVLAPVIRQIPYVITHVELFRGLSYAVLVTLTLWQVAIVFMTLFPADVVLRSSQKNEASLKIANRKKGLRPE